MFLLLLLTVHYDPRLNKLSELSKSKRAVPASIELVDIAGLVNGASQGEGLGNKFLSHIREVDSILQVVRCFEDNDIVHVYGKIDPKSDIEVINLELVFSDIDQVEKRIEKLKKGKSRDPQIKMKKEECSELRKQKDKKEEQMKVIHPRIEVKDTEIDHSWQEYQLEGHDAIREKDHNLNFKARLQLSE